MPWKSWIRFAAWCALALFVIGGPLYTQVFKQRSRWIRPWRMYSSKGLEACRLEFRRRDLDGDETRLERLALLGYPRWVDAPKNVRLVTDTAKAERQGRTICARLGGRADVRMYLDCGKKRARWAPRAQGERNLCQR